VHAAVGVDGEGVDPGGELDVGDEDLGAVGQGGGDRGEQLGDGGPGGHPFGGDADELGEVFAGGLDGPGPTLPRAGSAPVFVEGRLEGVPPAPRRRTV
jgi:hypothetical protein